MSGQRSAERIVGRYALYGPIASGGMATVHFGRLVGEAGFSRTVAIKRLHPQLAEDPEFTAMFLDEARLAARIQHPNVVPTLDVVSLDHELFLVMEYIQGESLARLIRAHREHREHREHRDQHRRAPLTIASSIVSAVLHGLHAAHIAVTELGEPLHIVHRDVSPENVLVGVDGVPRILDFGVAKARGRIHTTREGQIKGKLAYMAPEQVRALPVDARTDVYGASVVLWELLTGRRLFTGDNEGALLMKVIQGEIPRPAQLVPDLPPALDDIIMRGLALDPDARFPTAWDMAVALEDSVGIASPRQIGAWVDQLAGAALSRRARQVQEIESVSRPASLIPPGASSRPGGSPPSSPGLPPSSPGLTPLSQPGLTPPSQPGLAPPSQPGLTPLSQPGLTPLSQPGLTPLSQPGLAPPSSAGQQHPHASASSGNGALTPPPGWSATHVSGGTTSSSPHHPAPSPTPGAPSRSGTFRVTALVIVAASLGGLAATAALTLKRDGHPAPTSTSTATSAASTVAPSPSGPDPLPAPSPSPSAQLPSASATASAPPSSAPAASSAGPSAPAQPPSPGTARPTPGTKPARPSCNPPYTVDSRGIRRIKPECM
ncbi:serine/threonine-protein kinase [Chondromyces apiculatus]|uniref:Serine/threonine protein kinase n=1 Tax=Chondromyces apiculatus DSM 436 TaxID=1192034 RepID=A0A017T5G5_9BACT|nr:serine/threonine-protein kinase [Chondromyces apiculatus]EYF04474.1 serine/threonine protein kinase [Chondromyces apiculatus DSM 436]